MKLSNILKVGVISLSLIMTACGSSSSGNRALVPNNQNCQFATQQFDGSYIYNGQIINCSNFQGSFNNNGFVFNNNGSSIYAGIDWSFNPYFGTNQTGLNQPIYNPFSANGQPISNSSDDGCQFEDAATGAILGGTLGYFLGGDNAALVSVAAGTAGAFVGCEVFD